MLTTIDVISESVFFSSWAHKSDETPAYVAFNFTRQRCTWSFTHHWHEENLWRSINRIFNIEMIALHELLVPFTNILRRRTQSSSSIIPHTYDERGIVARVVYCMICRKNLRSWENCTPFWKSWRRRRQGSIIPLLYGAVPLAAHSPPPKFYCSRFQNKFSARLLMPTWNENHLRNCRKKRSLKTYGQLRQWDTQCEVRYGRYNARNYCHANPN